MEFFKNKYLLFAAAALTLTGFASAISIPVVQEGEVHVYNSNTSSYVNTGFPITHTSGGNLPIGYTANDWNGNGKLDLSGVGIGGGGNNIHQVFEYSSGIIQNQGLQGDVVVGHGVSSQGDYNNDGNPEVWMYEFEDGLLDDDLNLIAYNQNGFVDAIETGFNTTRLGYQTDCNDDGGAGLTINRLQGGNDVLTCYDVVNENVEWNYQAGEPVQPGPSADFDSDGSKETVGFRTNSGDLVLVNNSGLVEDTYSVENSSLFQHRSTGFGIPGDLDQDGTPEHLIVDDDTGGSEALWIFNWDSQPQKIRVTTTTASPQTFVSRGGYANQEPNIINSTADQVGNIGVIDPGYTPFNEGDQIDIYSVINDTELDVKNASITVERNNASVVAAETVSSSSNDEWGRDGSTDFTANGSNVYRVNVTSYDLENQEANRSFLFDSVNVKPVIDQVTTSPKDWFLGDNVDISALIRDGGGVGNISTAYISVYENGSLIVDNQSMTQSPVNPDQWAKVDAFTVDQEFVYYNATIWAEDTDTAENTVGKTQVSQFVVDRRPLITGLQLEGSYSTGEELVNGQEIVNGFLTLLVIGAVVILGIRIAL